MNNLKAGALRSFEHYAATEAMVRKQVWTVVDDRERLENATKCDVRRMFNEWVNSPEAAAEQPNAKDTPATSFSPRYAFCIHVDETSLRSVLDDSKDWHLNFINRFWIPEEEESDYEDPDEDDFTEEELEEQRLAAIWPEIEGCTEEDVGWYKERRGIVVSGYVSFFSDFGHQKSWRLWYTRPPQLAC